MDPEAETEVKDEAPAPAEPDNAAPSALATTPNLIEPLVEANAKPIEPVQPPARARPSDPIIGELTAQRQRRREAEERAAQVARENADLRAMVERLSKGQASSQDGSRPQPQPQPTIDDAAINRMAEYKLFLRDVESLRARGTSQYGAEFTNTIRNLGAVGADQDPFVHSVMAVGGDKAHELLHELAQDIDRTVGLVNMRPETSHCGANQNDHEGPTGGSCRIRAGQACRNRQGRQQGPRARAGAQFEHVEDRRLAR